MSAPLYVSNIDPEAVIEPVAGPFDLRSIGPVPAGLDGTWIGAGDPAVEVRWPGLGLEATMRVASGAPVCIAVASPEGAGAVALEPQTHAPWGLRRFLAGDAHGLTALAAGATLSLSIEIELRRPA